MVVSVTRISAVALVALALAGCSSTGGPRSDLTVGAPQVAASGSSQVRFTPYSGRSAVGLLPKPYFVSFRARNAESYGHSFIAYGELDSTGRVPYDRSGVLVPSMVKIAGFHPAGGEAAYSLGHLVPVPALTGASDGDTEIAYLQNEMTIALTPDEYQRVVAFMNKKQGSLTVWNAVVYNCSSFTNDVAEFMGMRGVNHLLFPRNYIEALKDANPRVETLPASISSAEAPGTPGRSLT